MRRFQESGTEQSQRIVDLRNNPTSCLHGDVVDKIYHKKLVLILVEPLYYISYCVLELRGSLSNNKLRYRWNEVKETFLDQLCTFSLSKFQLSNSVLPSDSQCVLLYLSFGNLYTSCNSSFSSWTSSSSNSSSLLCTQLRVVLGLALTFI